MALRHLILPCCGLIRWSFRKYYFAQIKIHFSKDLDLERRSISKYYEIALFFSEIRQRDRDKDTIEVCHIYDKLISGGNIIFLVA